MAKVLTLTLKKKWFDMILSGEKKEEYREIKPYWIRRLKNPDFEQSEFIKFDRVLFKNGYQKNARKMTFKDCRISIGTAKPEWSDNWQGDVFVIKLGEIIETNLQSNK